MELPTDLVDASSVVPPYEQVRLGIAERIRTGELATGTRLPSVRALAAELSLAANTVALAYRELEASGLVATGGRNGTVVAAAGDRVRAQAAAAAARYVADVRGLGVDDGEAIALVRAALGRRSTTAI